MKKLHCSAIFLVQKNVMLFCFVTQAFGYTTALDIRKLKQLLYEVSRGLYFMSLSSTGQPRPLQSYERLLADLVYSIFLPTFARSKNLQVSTDLHREIKCKRIQTLITFEWQDSCSTVISGKGLRFQENTFPLLKEKLICVIQHDVSMYARREKRKEKQNVY